MNHIAQLTKCTSATSSDMFCLGLYHVVFSNLVIQRKKVIKCSGIHIQTVQQPTYPHFPVVNRPSLKYASQGL